MTERIRVACCDESGTVVDLIVVEDFIAWAEKAAPLIEAKWKGGIYALAARPSEASVSVGYKRDAKGVYTAPEVVEDPAEVAGKIEAAFAEGLSVSTMTAAQQKRLLAFVCRRMGINIKP